MGLLDRMGKLVSSNVNAAVSKAEDPAKMIEQALHDMEENLRKVTAKRVEVATSLKQTEKSIQNLKARSQECEAKAMTAVKAGREDLARLALEEKASVDAQLAEAGQAAQL